MKNLANALSNIGKGIFSRGTVKDVFVWQDNYGSLRSAWLVDPKKLQALLKSPLRGEYIEANLRHMLGRTTSFQYERGPVDWFDFFDRLTMEVANALDMDDGFRLTFIPEPGFPYPGQYYSLKQGKTLRPRKPSWLLPEEVYDPSSGEIYPGVDLCYLYEINNPPRIGATLIDFGGKLPAMVTHSFGRQDLKEAGESIKRCGGMLAPSLAISQFPGVDYGPICFVADAGTVLSSLKPMKPRGKSWARVYNTDAWTETTSQLYSRGAISAYDQLHGQSDYMSHYDQHVWSLGIPEEIEGSDTMTGQTVEYIDTASKLKKTLKGLERVWKPGANFEATRDKHERSNLRYPYREAKLSGKVSPNIFSACYFPDYLKTEVHAFLRKIGYVGRVFPVKGLASPRLYETKDPQAIYDYGWAMAEVIREGSSSTVAI